MTRVLLTAFEPYGRWPVNASWLVVERITRELPAAPEITTRRYPVEFRSACNRLAADLAEDYDVALMLGQASSRSAIDLEAIALNVALPSGLPPEDSRPLIEDGPVAYRSSLPLEHWAHELRAQGMPCRVSFHAGTYLCNAAHYWAHYFSEQWNLMTKAALIHVPLDPTQVAQDEAPGASLPVEVSTLAVQWILTQLAETQLA